MDDILDILQKTDKHFPQVSIVVKDTIDGSPVFLGFNHYYADTADTAKPARKNFIMSTTQPEREYLNKVFNENYSETRYGANDGNYELYYPYIGKGKKIVFYFSEYQRYGKIGS